MIVLTMKIRKTMLTMKMTRTMLTKRIIVLTILRRHSSAHRRRSSSNLLQSQAPVTASPVRRRIKEKIHISGASECADDEDVDDDKVLPAWWVCTKLPWPLFPTFEVLQTSNSSSSLSPIIRMTILFITAGEIRPLEI